MKYLLPKELGGGEREPFIDGTGTMAAQFRGDGWQLFVDRSHLTPVALPVPEEPEPGPYLIGDKVAVRFAVSPGEASWVCATKGGTDWMYVHSWEDVWKELGGPDVSIQRLVPAPAKVELPWKGESAYGTVTVIKPNRELGTVSVVIGETQSVGAELAPATAREMAAALWTAAGEP